MKKSDVFLFVSPQVRKFFWGSSEKQEIPPGFAVSRRTRRQIAESEKRMADIGCVKIDNPDSRYRTIRYL